MYEKYQNLVEIVLDVQNLPPFKSHFKKKVPKTEKDEENSDEEVEKVKEKVNPHHKQLLQSNCYLNFLEKNELDKFYYVNEDALYKNEVKVEEEDSEDDDDDNDEDQEE